MTARELFPMLADFADRRSSGHDPGLRARRLEARQALDLIDRLRNPSLSDAFSLWEEAASKITFVKIPHDPESDFA